jgi:gamma-glutamyltranspeptidase
MSTSSNIVNNSKNSKDHNIKATTTTSYSSTAPSTLYRTGVHVRRNSNPLNGSVGSNNTITTSKSVVAFNNINSSTSYHKECSSTKTANNIPANHIFLKRPLNDCDDFQVNRGTTGCSVNSTSSFNSRSYQKQPNNELSSNEKVKARSGIGSGLWHRGFDNIYQRIMSFPVKSLKYERASTNDNEYDDENDNNDDNYYDDDNNFINKDDNSNNNNNRRKLNSVGIELRRKSRQRQHQQQPSSGFSNRIEPLTIQQSTTSTGYCSYKILFCIVSSVLLILLVQLGLTSVIVISDSGDAKERSSSILSSLFAGYLQSNRLKLSTTSCSENDESQLSHKILLQQNENILLKALAEDVDNDNDFVVVVQKEDLTAGVVASDQKVCSQLGVSILELGGNAIDAAVTTALCIGIVNPSSSGIGGGGFMLILADPLTKDDDDKYKDLYHDARDVDREPIVQIVQNTIKHVEVIDCREVAPLLSTVDMYINTTQPKASVLGGLAIAVPGELRGLQLAHKRHGKLNWDQLIQPVIDLAYDGIVVSKYLAHVILETSIKFGGDITHNRNARIRRIQSSSVQYNETWGLRNFITHGNNWDEPLKEGDIMKNPLLIATLTDIMNNGVDALYTGERAQELANDVQNAGGILTLDDIVNYKPTLRTPVVSTPDVNGFAIVGVPPPSSGGAVIIGALRFLSGFSQPLSTFADTLSIHRVIESMKHSFGIRMSLSDPSYNVDTVKEAVHDLVYGTYMDELRTNYYNDNTTITSLHHYGGTKWSLLDENEGDNVTVIDAHEGDRRRRLQQRSKQKEKQKLYEKQQPQKTNQQYRQKNRRRLYRSHGHLEDSGTSHFSIVDKDGNAVSMTTSINTVFGSMVVSKSTGILLGNTMDDFANPGVQDFFGIKPSEANYIQPGKKPLSSMSPTFVFEQSERRHKQQASIDLTRGPESLGRLILAVGGSGGPKIITAVLQVILNHIYLGKNMLESIIHPRVHNQLIYHGSSVTMIERATLDHIITNIEHDVLIEISNRTRTALIRRQHQIGTIDYTGCVQGIAIDLDTGTITGASDVRKGGSPAGT